MITLLLAFALQAKAQHFEQLTHQTGTIDFADPSRPDFAQGSTTLLTTNGYQLSWPSADSFFKADPPKIDELKICYPDGTQLIEDEEAIWDPTFKDGTLYGSVMSPPPNEKHAIWERDSITRRSYAFHLKNGCWTRNQDALVPSDIHSWIGHTYGHEFIEDDDGQTWMFYEKVSSNKNSAPWITELFARKMIDADHLDQNEVSIWRVRENQFPATHRSFGGELAEGPRPFKVGGIYFVSFSSGDYDSDRYGINLLWSHDIDGPYEPFLDPQGIDLKDFAADEVQRKHPMTMGGARGSFFEHDGQWWVVFHGVPLQTGPVATRSENRMLFLAPVEIETPENEPPRVTIHAD